MPLFIISSTITVSNANSNNYTITWNFLHLLWPSSSPWFGLRWFTKSVDLTTKKKYNSYLSVQTQSQHIISHHPEQTADKLDPIRLAVDAAWCIVGQVPANHHLQSDILWKTLLQSLHAKFYCGPKHKLETRYDEYAKNKIPQIPIFKYFFYIPIFAV